MEKYRLALDALRPEEMPEPVWHRLLNLLNTKTVQGLRPELKKIWCSKKGYWKAKFYLRGVRAMYYYNPKTERWIRA